MGINYPENQEAAYDRLKTEIESHSDANLEIHEFLTNFPFTISLNASQMSISFSV